MRCVHLDGNRALEIHQNADVDLTPKLKDSGPLSQRAAIAIVSGTHAEQYAQ